MDLTSALASLPMMDWGSLWVPQRCHLWLARKSGNWRFFIRWEHHPFRGFCHVTDEGNCFFKRRIHENPKAPRSDLPCIRISILAYYILMISNITMETSTIFYGKFHLLLAMETMVFGSVNRIEERIISTGWLCSNMSASPEYKPIC